MHWLSYFLTGAKARWKHPYLVLVLRSAEPGDGGSAGLNANDLLGVALYFEYRVGPLHTGAFSTDDMSGLRTVIAPREDRGEIAAMATEALLAHGAHVVVTSFEATGVTGAAHNAAGYPTASMASRTRVLGKHLLLKPTFEATMATLGKRTRTHMRYYQKRLVAKSGCTFHPNARRLLTSAEFAEANRTSLNPVSAADCELRYRSSTELPGAFLCGLCDAAGEWLSLAGGWRQGTTTVLQWQINRNGRERDSLRTVMRTFLLEDEVARGTERLLFYGGTSHSMRHSFMPEPVCDLIVRRGSLQARALMAVTRLISSPRSVTGRTNFMAEALHCATLVWTELPRRSPAVTLTRPERPDAPLFRSDITAAPLPREKTDAA